MNVLISGIPFLNELSRICANSLKSFPVTKPGLAIIFCEFPKTLIVSALAPASINSSSKCLAHLGKFFPGCPL